MKKIVIVIGILWLYSVNVLALECKVLDNIYNPYYETGIVGDVLVPKNFQNGQKIWISGLYTRNVECISNQSESVYFYFFPEVNNFSIPPGMKFGITYNGIDTDFDILIPEEYRRIKTNIYVHANTVTRGTIQVSLYIKKCGDIYSNGFYHNLNIYQLDGVGGLNAAPKNRNYRFSLSQLNNIVEVSCNSIFLGNRFNININNDLTLKPQLAPNIGILNITCTTNDNLKIIQKNLNLKIYFDKTNSSNIFNTNLPGLNFILNIAGYNLYPNNNINNPKNIILYLDNNGSANINVHAWFQLDYYDPSNNEFDWLYNPAISTFRLEKFSIKSVLIF